MAQEQPPPRQPSGLAQSIGALVIIAYLGLFVFAIWSIDTAEQIWTRIMVLFGGIEAILLLAAGTVFGSTVQRRHTIQEAARAERAEEQVVELEPDALVGRGLVARLESSEQTTARSISGLDSTVGGGGQTAPSSDEGTLSVKELLLFVDGMRRDHNR